MSSSISKGSPDARPDNARLVVTGAGIDARRRPRSALKKAVPGAQVQRAGFPSVFILEARGDAMEIAKTVVQRCSENIGHVTAVLDEVESRLEPIRDAAAHIGAEQIAAGEKFCFRLHKRGSHWLKENTCSLERQIGSVIWEAVKQRRGESPLVDLDDPDIIVIAEVLGPKTAIGISRKAWRAVAGSSE